MLASAPGGKNIESPSQPRPHSRLPRLSRPLKEAIRRTDTSRRQLLQSHEHRLLSWDRYPSDRVSLETPEDKPPPFVKRNCGNRRIGICRSSLTRAADKLPP